MAPGTFIHSIHSPAEAISVTSGPPAEGLHATPAQAAGSLPCPWWLTCGGVLVPLAKQNTQTGQLVGDGNSSHSSESWRSETTGAGKQVSGKARFLPHDPFPSNLMGTGQIGWRGSPLRPFIRALIPLPRAPPHDVITSHRPHLLTPPHWGIGLTKNIGWGVVSKL